MGMSSWALDNEEMFYSGADDAKIECETLEQFVDVMTPQMDLVSHLPKDEVLENLKGIWHD